MILERLHPKQHEYRRNSRTRILAESAHRVVSCDGLIAKKTKSIAQEKGDAMERSGDKSAETTKVIVLGLGSPYRSHPQQDNCFPRFA